MNKEQKQDKSLYFLSVSMLGIVLLVMCLFGFLAVFMNRKNTETIEEVGKTYMTGMSEQIFCHYDTTISLRFSQVRAIVEANPPDSAPYDKLIDKLAYNASAMGFNYLALCSADGDFEMIYGSQIKATAPEPFLKSLQEGNQKLTVGLDAEGSNVILLGVNGSYPMADGQDSIALVIGFSPDYINRLLFLDTDSKLVDSYIIRMCDRKVIHGGDTIADNYVDWFSSFFDGQKGKSVKQCVEEITQAMAAGEDCSILLNTNVRMGHLYCTKLSYSEWYLVTFLPFDLLSQALSDMSHQWIYMVYGGCAIALAAMGLVFSQYVKIVRRQMAVLAQANKEAEEARREAEYANKAKSEFLSNMSHDIRTPMNAIVGMTAIATANSDNHEQVQNCLRKIALSSKHLLGLINDVLDMSKIESGKMTLNVDQVSLREVMDSIVSIVQPQVKAKHQQFNIFIHDISVENVCCDSVRLNQILINILGNAVKFTPEEGSIHVSLYEEESPKGQDYIRTHIIVKDTGIGMSEEYRKKIFDSFSREDSARVQKTEGTGLGMAITKYIVDAMEGTIQVVSQLGKGSEFHVSLDLKRAEVQEMDMVLPDWNMLVVDDDEQLCESVVASLKSIGIKPDWCLDAESAIQMIEEQHQRHNDYHIILLDWKLPGMDGITAAKEIRRRYGNDIPIVLISAYDWSEIEDEALEAGVTGFIPKPLFKSTLFYGLRPFMQTADELVQESVSQTEDISLNGCHILLAEDNDLNWEIAEELLSQLGLDLTWAQNGQECVDKFQESQEGYYEAILMDVRMPIMDGYQATRFIRALGRADSALPIIAMTADAFAEDIQRCLEAGMNAHVAKPIDVREVMRLLKKFLK